MFADARRLLIWLRHYDLITSSWFDYVIMIWLRHHNLITSSITWWWIPNSDYSFDSRRYWTWATRLWAVCLNLTIRGIIAARAKALVASEYALEISATTMPKGPQIESRRCRLNYQCNNMCTIKINKDASCIKLKKKTFVSSSGQTCSVIVIINTPKDMPDLK